VATGPARALSKLYVARAAVSLVWVLILTWTDGTKHHAGSSALAETLVALYPLTDVIATLVDLNATTDRAPRRLQRANFLLSSIATATTCVALARDFSGALEVFALWAILSGAIQLLVAWRRNAIVGAQWFMVISGAGSVFAGTTFLSWNSSDVAATHALAQYSVGGALWYLLTAGWLAATSHTRPKPASVHS